MFFDICWYLFIIVVICCYLLIFVDICFHLLMFVDIRRCLLVFVNICWNCGYLAMLVEHARPLGEGRRIAFYCGCKSPKSIPRSIPKVYPGVYQKCCRSAHYAFVGFVFVIMCSYFLLFVCSRCLLMILGSVVIVWYLLLLVGIRKYS